MPPQIPRRNARRHAVIILACQAVCIIAVWIGVSLSTRSVGWAILATLLFCVLGFLVSSILFMTLLARRRRN